MMHVDTSLIIIQQQIITHFQIQEDHIFSAQNCQLFKNKHPRPNLGFDLTFTWQQQQQE